MAKALELPLRERGVCCVPDLTLAPQRAQATAEVLQALADPTRLQMVLALRESAEPICICDFTAAFDLSQPTISHHMGRLRGAGLVESRRQGVWTYYQLSPELPVRVRKLIDALG